jgi:drug/metabolite transporter (DMT)-like permease
MLMLAFSVGHHTTLRLVELAGAATAVAGGVLFLGSSGSGSRRGGQPLAGILLAVAGVLLVVAIRWGR